MEPSRSCPVGQTVSGCPAGGTAQSVKVETCTTLDGYLSLYDTLKRPAGKPLKLNFV